MKIIVFDRKKNTGQKLESLLRELCPEHTVFFSDDEEETRSYAAGHIYNLVFVCISDAGGNDMDLSRELSRMIPSVNLILVSEGKEYLEEALEIHASGYICLPLSEEKVRKRMDDLLYPVPEVSHIRIVRGKKPEIFINDEAVSFRYKKTKELLILLIDREDEILSSSTIKNNLWGWDRSPEKGNSYFQNIRSDLFHTLRRYGLENMVCHSRGSMWIDRDRFIEDKEL